VDMESQTVTKHFGNLDAADGEVCWKLDDSPPTGYCSWYECTGDIQEDAYCNFDAQNCLASLGGACGGKMYCPINNPPSTSSKNPTSAPIALSSAPSNYPSLTHGPSANIPENNNPLPLSWVISEATKPLLLMNDEDEHVLIIQYKASNRVYGVEMFEKDCYTKSSVPSLGLADSRSSTIGFINIHVNITLRQSDIEASSIWESSSSENGSFSFCLSTFLINGEDIVVSESTIFEVAIVNIINFNIGGINTYLPEPANVNNDFNIAYDGAIKAYECDPVTMNELSNPPNHGPYDILHICVEETSSDDLVISSFFSLNLKLVGGFATFNAIVNSGVPAEYENLALQKCTNGKCVASVQLIEEFFTNNEVKEIQVTGSVKIKSKNTRDSLNTVVHKEDGEEANGLFSLFVELDSISCDGNEKPLASLLSMIKIF